MINLIRFEWDERKNKANMLKHGLSFEEAQTVFFDDDGLLIADVGHSEDEERFLLLGLSVVGKSLVVCHCYREADTVIRLISARKASRSEQADYWRRKS